MTVISERGGRRRPQGRRGVRAGLSLLLVLGALLVSACGMRAQTLQPYTPAEGINFDVGDLSQPQTVVHVRNLLIISREGGEGIVSGTMITNGSDALTAISGRAVRSDGSLGAPFAVELAQPLTLAPNSMLVLTTVSPLLTVTSPDLVPGLTAEVTVELGRAGSQTSRITVVDGSFPPYTSISPTPSALSSSAEPGSPSPSPSA